MAEEQTKVRIFHVDDEAIQREQLARLMQRYGYQVVLTAGSVAQALPLIPDELLRRGVNVAVLDNKLPDGTGDQIAAKIRKAMQNLSIISLSTTAVDWGTWNINKNDGIRLIINAVQQAAAPKK